MITEEDIKEVLVNNEKILISLENIRIFLRIKVLSTVLGLTVIVGSFNVVLAVDAVSGASNWTPETTAKPAT